MVCGWMVAGDNEGQITEDKVKNKIQFNQKNIKQTKYFLCKKFNSIVTLESWHLCAHIYYKC